MTKETGGIGALSLKSELVKRAFTKKRIAISFAGRNSIKNLAI